jgi:glycogen debranching enzyme
VHCSPKPQQVSSSKFILHASLQPKEIKDYDLNVICSSSKPDPKPINYDAAARSVLHSSNHSSQEIYVANQAFNDWLSRSKADLNMMLTHTPSGPYPYAGVPWFNTSFGRDGIITAMCVLWIDPLVARNVLSYLASTQATKLAPEIEAEPGKIIHETRKSEMAILHEIPFGHYYGSVDVTPLFIMLAGAYYRRTADAQFISSIWPNIEAALRWIDEYGDCDKDGFVEYSKHAVKGLVQQGWKDSNDSVFHSDGSLAEGPIALCEVQGYVYAAKRFVSEMAGVFGKSQLAERLMKQARMLRKHFEEAFWCEDLSTYALALDGEKKQCRVRTSNPGHCLFTGIACREHALNVARTLMADDSFSGWGIRTVSSNELRYNAMSYHNGSIWPHDNALIARGFARYGQQRFTSQIVTGMLDASMFLELHRLPELFCGFTRRPGEGPIAYPVACAPQAWAAASAFALLEACLGITVRASPATVLFRHSHLPSSLPEVEIRNLQIGSATVDLAVRRTGDSVDLKLLKKNGNVDIVSVK